MTSRHARSGRFRVLELHVVQRAGSPVKQLELILQNDECGRLLMWELIKAAQRGVKVRVRESSLTVVPTLVKRAARTRGMARRPPRSRSG